VIHNVTDVMEVGTMSLCNITHKTESVPNLLTLIPQVVVIVDLVIKIHAQRTLSPSLEHQQFIPQSMGLNKLTNNTQYPSVLMLKIGALIHQVSLATVEPVSIIVYSLLDSVVTLIG